MICLGFLFIIWYIPIESIRNIRFVLLFVVVVVSSYVCVFVCFLSLDIVFNGFHRIASKPLISFVVGQAKATIALGFVEMACACVSVCVCISLTTNIKTQQKKGKDENHALIGDERSEPLANKCLN